VEVEEEEEVEVVVAAAAVADEEAVPCRRRGLLLSWCLRRGESGLVGVLLLWIGPEAEDLALAWRGDDAGEEFADDGCFFLLRFSAEELLREDDGLPVVDEGEEANAESELARRGEAIGDLGDGGVASSSSASPWCRWRRLDEVEDDEERWWPRVFCR